MEPEELARQLDRLRAGIARAGIKLTHQRLEIFREVAGSGEHPDAETIYRGVRERVPSVSLDTVYRTLWLLLDLGLITTLGARDRVRFDGNMKPHHHFVCSKCGLTRDFYSDEFDHLQIPEAVHSFGSVQKAQVEVKGVCNRCSQDKEALREDGISTQEALP